MKIKTSELTGAALDWAVVKCEGATNLWRPSTEWAQGGPIIEREKISLDWAYRMEWEGRIYAPDEEPWIFNAPTPLIAAMRCYVASKLGDEVDVPDELI